MNLLILSHQGLSFLEDLTRTARELGLKVSILSSRPAAGAERIAKLQEMSDWLRVIDSSALSSKDVEAALKGLANEFETPVACISVWEGYRSFVAQANQQLGAPDCTPLVIDSLIDKYQMRRQLVDSCLSSVSSHLLTADNFDRLSDPSRGAKFVKPRFGLGSFGAQRMSGFSRDAWKSIQSQMQTDIEYAGVFRSSDLIVEDYIPGLEYAFEVIVLDGEAHILAIHEKVELDESGSAVLENACVSPPRSLSQAQQSLGVAHIKACLKAMKAIQGCFHIEARFDEGSERWEILEMNPRVGGSLINRSVQFQTRGDFCLLKLWIQTLVAKGDDRSALSKSLRTATVELSPSRRNIFFRVFFGKSGAEIQSVTTETEFVAPLFSQIYVKAGAKLSPSAREIFLGQALWELTSSDLIKKSKDYLQVKYA